MADALKHEIGPAVVSDLAGRFAAADPDFDRGGFVAAVLPRLGGLELKARIDCCADAIASSMPHPYAESLDVVVAVAEGGVEGWSAWPLCSFVERHGVRHPEPSLRAMPALTRRWSCEFAIRPFLDAHLDLTRVHLRRWVVDPDEAVRRLASEGTRPRLPWGRRVAALLDDPWIGLELLEALRHDPSETVRRSVANHLNDLARADSGLVIDVVSRWSGEHPSVDARMVRHGLRTLTKAGDPRALAVLGFTTDARVAVAEFRCEPAVVDLGGQLELTAELSSSVDVEQVLVVDFVIHHVNARGATTEKVFKWTTCRLGPGECVRLSKRRRIVDMSTRTYHAGVHVVELQIAGRRMASAEFELRR